MILTILITIYILSFLRMYSWVKNAFNKNGVFSYSNPKFIDFIVTVVPIVNTLVSFLVIQHSWTGKKYNSFESKSLDFSKFFNVKK
jgi:hypothetical protein